MRVDQSYIEMRAQELYEQTHPIKLFRDESVDRNTRIQRIQVMNGPSMPSMVGEDEAMPMDQATYEEEEVHLHFIGAEYDKHQSNAASQDRALQSFDENFVHSFTDAIHRELKDNVEKVDLDYDSVNGILFEAGIEGRMEILERAHAEPDAMLVGDSVAEDIIDDSVFEEWEPIARDIEEEFGYDVFHDQFNALYGNEVLLVDRSRFGVQYHARELYAHDKFDRIEAGMKGGFKVLDGDVAVRLAT
jgi:hypothetical protein